MSPAPTLGVLTDVIIEELVRDKRGGPLLISEAVDLETGVLCKAVFDRLRGASEVRMSYDGVWVKRYATVEELQGLLERKAGGCP